ncbi:MAG: 50S ribosomal protein L29 [Nitrosomonas sp.]|jgi:large subunit ribosomal protein L29|nr:50S ribosomal protein L29 [Nitrosomonas sp.]
MKANELMNMTIPELQKELLTLLRAQFGLRMQKATQQLGNTNQIRIIRRDIARVKTVMGQKSNQL